MENEKKPKGRRKRLRQEWNPHWLIKIAYGVLSVVLSLVKVAVMAATTVVLILLICAAVFTGTLGDYLQEDVLAEADNWSMDDFDLERTSFIYYVDSSGDIQQLQQIYTATDRQWAPLEEIPEAMVNAAIAIEDKRFYEHQGVDWITTVKACLNMFFGGDEQFGGSTITQQLIKNLTDEKSVTVQRKVMEIFRAQTFERRYDKDLIMEYYLNEIYLGRGCYGVKSAAAEYFGKELQTLTPAECASLISITNNPSLFNPYSDNVFTYEGVETDGAARNRSRQLKVLYQMLDQGYLTREEYDEAVAQEMVFKSGIADEDRWTVCENLSCRYAGIRSTFTGEGDSWYCPRCGNLTSVNTSASQYIYSWFVDAVIIDLASYLAEQDGRKWDEMSQDARDVYLNRIQKGGYHIYTTLDMDVQKQVNEIYEDTSNMPKIWNATQQLQSAIVVIDNNTGDVVALSGGVGEKTDFLGYNRATQAKLQTGSSQKPISVYAPAFETGTVTPASVFKDLPVYYDEEGNNWPKNDNRQYQYARTVYQGIVSSVNTVSARTLDFIGADYGYSFAKYNFGQNSLVERYDTVYETKSDIGLAPLALGALTLGSTVREMSAAYATFANDGTWREPRLYTKVYNSDGDLVVDNTQDNRKILSDKTVNYMNYCLYNAATHGTGGAAIFGGQTIAGKTGTTSSNRDRWFCGYTAHYTAAVWVGYDQPEQINVGTNPAAILWRKVMQPVHKGLPKQGLYNADVFQSVGMCLDSGKKATAACQSDARGMQRVVYANVYPEDAEEETCDKHVMVEYCLGGEGVANEYCSQYPDNGVVGRALVKMTREEVQAIKDALRVGLNDAYSMNGYVYLVNDDGSDGAWHGFYGNINDGVDAPYVVCQVHTAGFTADDEGSDDGSDDGFIDNDDDAWDDVQFDG